MVQGYLAHMKLHPRRAHIQGSWILESLTSRLESNKEEQEVEGNIEPRIVQRLREGLIFTVHRLLYHSTLGSRVIKKKSRE